MKKLPFLGVAFFGLLVAVCFYIYDTRLGERKMVALLNGDQRVLITSFATKHQQRRLRCTDGEVLRCIEQAIMKHPTVMTGVGTFSYYGYFKLKGGGTFGGYMRIDSNGFVLSVSSLASEEGLMTHSLLLNQPVPAKVRQVFTFLAEPHQTAAGKVLVLQEGKPEREVHDEALGAK